MNTKVSAKTATERRDKHLHQRWCMVERVACCTYTHLVAALLMSSREKRGLGDCFNKQQRTPASSMRPIITGALIDLSMVLAYITL